MRVIAVDWSGRKRGAQKAIWLAEVADGRVVRLEAGRDRRELVEHLLALAKGDPAFIVGFDFAFSLPAWFLRSKGMTSARELWALLMVEADEWLRDPQPPFWGLGGKAASGLTAEEEFRRTDREYPAVRGVQAQSVFKLVGAGQVGPGSLRGMPALHELSSAGFSVWPFDEPGRPTVVEIYPRLLTGRVVKTDPERRLTYLERFGELDPGLRLRAAASEDAFDALVSALVMWRHRDELLTLERHPDYELEGRIWAPAEGV